MSHRSRSTSTSLSTINTAHSCWDQAPGAPGPWTVITIRRFFARLAGVSLGATGWVSPNPLAEMTFGLMPCGDQIGHDGAGAARRQCQVVVDPGPLQFGPDRRVIGIAIDDDCRVGQAFEPGNDVVRQLGLASGAQLIAARREQQIAGLDKTRLSLQCRELSLELLVLRFELLMLRLQLVDRRSARRSSTTTMRLAEWR